MAIVNGRVERRQERQDILKGIGEIRVEVNKK